MEATLFADNIYLSEALYSDVVSGKKKLCISAIYIIYDVMQKLRVMISNLFGQKDSDKDTLVNKHELGANILKLAFCGKLLWRAFETDPDDIFFSTTKQEDIEILSKHVVAVEPHDFEDMKIRLQNYKSQQAMVFWKTTKIFRETMELKLFYKLPYYNISYALINKSTAFGALAVSRIQDESWINLGRFAYNPIAQKMMKSRLATSVELDQFIFIPFSQEDILTQENIMDTTPPKMMQEDMDLPFFVDEKEFDPEKHLRMQVMSHQDWNRVNWEEGKLIDPDSEPVDVKAAIFYIHGGGWVLSAFSQEEFVRRISKELNIPVFGIKHRLAPMGHFPILNNDVFQGYCWVRNYAEKYLKLRFDKIIWYGCSAGGHLVMTFPLTCKQKQVRIPDGIIPIAPVANVDTTMFVPSWLIGIDDPLLSTANMEFYEKSYRGQLKPNENFHMNPFVAPDEAFLEDGKVKFPMTRVIIGGNDILRDHALLHILRLGKLELILNLLCTY